MINEVYIENVALIKEATVTFKKGLNIISGETGVGKSILLNSLFFLFGGRSNKNFIREGEKKAEVRGILSIENIKTELNPNIEMYKDENNEILFSRIYYRTGKNIYKINNKIVTLGMIKEIASLLVEEHSQRQHQVLLDKKHHIILVDEFEKNKINYLKDKLKIEIEEYREYKRNLEEIHTNTREKEVKIDILKYQIREIEELKLEDGEEEILLSNKKKQNNGEKLSNTLNEAAFLLSSGDNMILDKMNILTSLLEKIKDIDNECEEMNEKAKSSLANLEDLSFNIRSYFDTLEFNNEELEDIEARLDEIYKIKKKYGDTISDVLKLLEEKKDELQKLDLDDIYIEGLKTKINNKLTIIKKICSDINKIRLNSSKIIEKKVMKDLEELHMQGTIFKIIVEKRENFNENGSDNVFFMISTNKGEKLKPLEQIISGGEMSRLTLALKNSLASNNEIETFIFDEIDVGISGLTAHKVGEKIKSLSKKNQIICITHLPQIASLGDNHIYVEKENKKNETYSKIKEIKGEKIVDEIARLLSGNKITIESKKAAKQLLNNEINN